MKKELTEEEKKKDRAGAILFEQELNRGTWSVEKEIEELVKFVENEKQEANDSGGEKE